MPIFPATSENIARAARRLQNGDLVAFPTETVYGLGANALDSNAVTQIFACKGRPATNPLIVHVASIEKARELVNWNERAQVLAEKFWPGPLTVILPRKNALSLPAAISAGLSTLAVRVPAHPVALELLQNAQIPLAAPSANRSNALSPTHAQHVLDSLGEEIWVLDGGPCQVGIESTVLDLSGENPTILRPGTLEIARIEAQIGPVQTLENSEVEGEKPQISPGQGARHYAPRARLHLFVGLTDAHFHAVSLGSGLKIGVLSFEPTSLDARHILMPSSPRAYAQKLFAALHELDGEVELILIEQVPFTRDWDGVRDRLTRASR